LAVCALALKGLCQHSKEDSAEARSTERSALTKSAKARRQLVSHRVFQCAANERMGAGGRMPGLQ